MSVVAFHSNEAGKGWEGRLSIAENNSLHVDEDQKPLSLFDFHLCYYIFILIKI
jgi:hypothetical protein